MDQRHVLERGDELERLTAAVADARRGQGRLVVVRADAGMGKTRLLRAVREVAADAASLALAARGTPFELDNPFGIVRQLFETTVAAAGDEERRHLLSGGAALAAPIIDQAVPDDLPRSPGAATAASLHGLYWLCSNLAERRPLLLTIDDAQWGDPASLRYLAYLAPRLADLPVAVVVSLRTGEIDDLLGQLVTDPVAEVLSPRPLSLGAVGALVATAFTTPPAPEFIGACHHATGGNPFLLGELLAELSRRGVGTDARSALLVEKTTPQTVAMAVQVRLDRLPETDRRLARTVAVLGGQADLRLAAALVDATMAEAARAADRLAAAGIVESARPLRFVHPIVGNAIDAGMPSAEREIGHERAARYLDDLNPLREDAAVHLLSVEPRGEEWVAQRLRAAAEHAVARGAPRAAVRFLDRALAEPLPEAIRTETLTALGTVEAHLGSPHAVGHLREALGRAGSPRTRVPIVVECAAALSAAGRVGEAVGLLDQTIAALDDTDHEVGLELEGQRAVIARMDVSTGQEAARAPLRFSAPVSAGDRSAGGRLLLADAAYVAATSGQTADASAALAERALAGSTGLWPRHGSTAAAAAVQNVQALYVLLVADRFSRVEQILGIELELAAREGAAMPHALALGWSSHAALRRGALAEAEDCAERAYQLVRLHQWDGWQPVVLAFLVSALVERGRVDDADRRLADDGFLGRLPEGIGFDFLLDSRAGLRLAQDAGTVALDDLRELAAREQDRGTGNPAMCPWRSRSALALAAIGRPAEARRLADEEVELARAFGAARALGMALRVAGVVHPGRAGLARLEEAADVLEDSPARLELARTLADLGTALRRLGGEKHDAVQPLHRAFGLATACGAATLAERVRGELLAAGGSERWSRTAEGRQGLTPSEQRVVALARDGLANRDIAQALFVSLKTVEMHLSHAYTKLGIRSRVQLPDVFADPTDRGPWLPTQGGGGRPPALIRRPPGVKSQG